MTQQTINIGSSANDGTGDPLRTAFDKINDNFNELYPVSGAGAGNNLSISGNSLISANVDGDIILDPNGTGDVVIAIGSTIKFTTFTSGGIPHFDASGNITSSGVIKYVDGYGAEIESILLVGGAIKTINSNQDLQIDPSGTGTVHFVVPTQTTVGAAGGASAVPATPDIYFKIKVDGTYYVVPAFAVS